MSDLLFRLGERALGTGAKARPLLRPAFAAPPASDQPLDMALAPREVTAQQRFSSDERFPIKLNLQAAEEDHLDTAQPRARELRKGPARDQLTATDTLPTEKTPSHAQVTERSLGLDDSIKESAAHDPNARPPLTAMNEERLPAPLFDQEKRSRPTLADVMAHLYPGDAFVTPAASENYPGGVQARPSIASPASAGSQQAPQEAEATLATHLPQMRPAARPSLDGNAKRDSTQINETRSVTEVQVTIGKIELHAAAPPPVHMQPPPPARTTLSLDTYLARRRGERA